MPGYAVLQSSFLKWEYGPSRLSGSLKGVQGSSQYNCGEYSTGVSFVDRYYIRSWNTVPWDLEKLGAQWRPPGEEAVAQRRGVPLVEHQRCLSCLTVFIPEGSFDRCCSGRKLANTGQPEYLPSSPWVLGKRSRLFGHGSVGPSPFKFPY